MARVLTVLGLFFAFGAIAQNQNRIDSLRSMLKERSGKELFDLTSALAWEYRLVIPDSAVQVGKRAYEMGKKLGLEKELARPINFIGVGYEYKGAVAEAYDFYNEALEVATRQGDNLQIAYANNNLGRLFLDQGNAIKSHEAHQTALTLFESLNDLAGIAYVYLNLAKLYQSQKDFTRAEDYFLKMVDTRMRLEKTLNISSLIQLGDFYRESGDIKKSDVYLYQADSLCVVRKNEVQRAEINFLLASNRLKEGKLREAEAFAQKSMAYSASKKLNPARTLNVAGKIKFEQNDLTKAKEYFKRVLDNSKTFNEAHLRMDAHFYLFQIYSREGARDQKLQNENRYLALKDTLREIELSKQLDKLKFQFKLEMEQQKRENELLKTLDSRNTTIIRKQQIINSIYVVALVVIIVIAFLQFRNAKVKGRLNAELERKQEMILKQSNELQASNSEIEKINSNLEKLVEQRTQTIKAKNKLLTEYAYFNSHQIRGPLARILGLITVIHLESKDIDYSHVKMLQQAGRDMDEAIRRISNLIDDVSE